MLISKRAKIASTFIGYLSVSVILILVGSLAIKSFTAASTGGFTLRNFRFLYQEIREIDLILGVIWPFFLNSSQFTLITSVLDIAVSTMAAYALSRLEFKGKKIILNTLFLLYAFPAISLLISIFYVLNFIGLINTMVGVILVKLSLGIPMGTYLLKGFFDDVSWELEWSSYVDGCSKFSCFRKILIPCIMPGIFSVFTLALLNNWAEFIILASFIYDPELYPISLYLRTAMGDPSLGGHDTHIISAVALVYILPVLIYFFGAQIIMLKKNTRAGIGKGI
ncbi:MAG: carbohydrate ABC transporter permease [Candidatus Latescibacteria bacterium]|nr:carbohydrate ABC transporter permease [Candidatus Latescibacterota bacterium]